MKLNFRSTLIKPAAALTARRIQRDAKRAEEIQVRMLEKLLRKAASTHFGKAHGFSSIGTYDDFKERVPLRNYEDLKHYVELVKKGGKDVLWPGKPAYFAKTSGTTSGTKYIPVTRESVGYQIRAARDALFNYAHETGNYAMFDGKLIFLTGSPELDEVGGVATGRLSGIVNHHVPAWLRSNQVPGYETNCIVDWEEKIDQIVKETINLDMRLISGIPPWVQMYFDLLIERSGKSIQELFPNFTLLAHGGVNFEPYREKMMRSIGKTVDNLETYPASEGFFAFQDTQSEHSLLLNVDGGIFYEFVPANEIFDEHPARLRLDEVELGVNYAIIINNNAGLWGYVIGDTVKFVSKNPYKLFVTGRTKHFISAFGEHVIAEEVEGALTKAAQAIPFSIFEFTVAPRITVGEGQLPHHEWYMEFDEPPADLQALEANIDADMRKRNSYYDDLVEGAILRPLKIIPLKRGAFQAYMRSIGKLGGQNKVPRLSNDRRIADFLEGQKMES